MQLECGSDLYSENISSKFELCNIKKERPTNPPIPHEVDGSTNQSCLLRGSEPNINLKDTPLDKEPRSTVFC